jgi:hypothetical protein
MNFRENLLSIFVGVVDLVVWLAIIVGVLTGQGFTYGLILVFGYFIVGCVTVGWFGAIFLIIRAVLYLSAKY